MQIMQGPSRLDKAREYMQSEPAHRPEIQGQQDDGDNKVQHKGIPVHPFADDIPGPGSDLPGAERFSCPGLHLDKVQRRAVTPP